MGKERTELVGLVPAGGKGIRIEPLPLSKELFPLGFCSMPGQEGPRPMVAAQYLLESLRRAGVERTFVLLRKGKWDIPAYLGDGAQVGCRLVYLILDQTPGVPFTVDAAYHHVRSCRVAFGFPDIVHEPESAHQRMVEQLERGGTDVVLGVFPVHRCEKMDMVDIDAKGRVLSVVIKPARTELRYTWILAVWEPSFTEFLHSFVSRERERINDAKGADRSELFMGDVLQAALEAGMRMETVLFDSGSYLDIGTPEDLMEAVLRTAQTARSWNDHC
jgi:glucose-1-phosphate thymidylyltransferase